MPAAHSTAARNRSVIALMLAMMLLFAQWSGFAHRIDHASLLQAQAFADSFGDKNSGDTEPRHSCIAFDAAAVADAVALPPFVAPLLTSTEVLALWLAFASWDAPPAHPFCPRAPPFA